MSNEKDLDWLARNVHVWCLFCDAVAIVRDGEVTFHQPNKGFANAITIDQWIARRAELHVAQNQFKPSIEEANRLAKELKPFASIEDNQEQGMKQDNGWFERGELPPAGIECEVRARGDDWKRVITIGIDNEGAMVVQFLDDEIPYHGCTMPSRFRPIRTERDVLMSILECYGGALPKQHQRSEVADAILAAGFKLEAK